LGAAEAADLSLPVDQACLVVEDEALAAFPCEPFPAPQGPRNLAYVLFTSGSTGRPKGVLLEGQGLSLALQDTVAAFDVGPQDRAFGITALHHDMSLWDVFGVLGAGGSLVLPPAEGVRDPAAWISLLESRAVTLWNSVPAFLTMLLEHVSAGHPLQLPALRLAFVGGDWIPLSQPEALRALAPRARLVSVGGPTETTLWNVWYPVDRVDPSWKSVPYGRPIPHAEVRVLGEGGHEAPDLVPGELVAVGPGVTRGYLDDPERTAERQGLDLASGLRTWRTGDLGRFLRDGNLEFLGRKDRMLKVLGQRIEPGEVEAALRAHPEVVDAAVDAPLEGGQRRRLVAWVVLRNTMLQLDDLRAWLAGRLPPALVPGLILPLEALPLSANGKVDRARLRLPEAAAASVPTNSAGLARVLAIVEEVLGQRGITADTDLIALGANSIDLLRLSNRVEAELGIRPSPAALFRAPTVRGLLSAVGGAGETEDDRAPVALRDRLSSYRIIADPAGRDAFRRRGLGVRAEEGRPRHPLPGGALDEATLVRYAARHSVRSYALRPVPEESLGRLLAVLRRITVEDRPRYLYPSGGGLYPLQVYLHARPGRVAGIEAGTWYYHPVEHALIPVRLGPDIPRGVHAPFINQPIYDEAAFSLFFLCDLDAIGPLYGRDSVHIATLEAGIVGQLLDVESRSIGLGLCHVGRLNFEEIRPLFQLSDSQILIHSMLGGLPADGPSPSGADDGVRASRLLERVRQLGPDEVRALLAARKAAGGKA
jgi:amino acid adenylation domain-containing protein